MLVGTMRSSAMGSDWAAQNLTPPCQAVKPSLAWASAPLLACLHGAEASLHHCEEPNWHPCLAQLDNSRFWAGGKRELM